jgi:hypothetical protein
MTDVDVDHRPLRVILFGSQFASVDDSEAMGISASYTYRSAAVTFGRGALMSLPMPPNERLSMTEPSGALASCA